MVIGTDEHPGRVRAVGQAIPIRTYFHEPHQRRGSMTNEEMDRLLDVKVNAMKEKLMDEINIKYNLILCSLSHHEDNEVGDPCPPMKSGYDSCMISKELSQLSEGIYLCDLAIDHDIDNLVVARGKFYNIGGDAPFLHNQPLGVYNVRVSILKIIVDGALLPFLTEDIKIVGNDAIGSFFAWPKRLVIWATETKNKEKVDARRPLDEWSLPSKGSMSVNLPKHNAAKDNVMSFSLRALRKIALTMKVGEVSTIHMHASIFGHERTMPINRSEILQLIGKKEIGAACISIYMNGHWMLCVIDPHKTTVNWLDLLIGPIREDIEDVINSAIAIFISGRGNKNVRSTNISTKWKIIQFNSKLVYTDEEVDEVRDQLACYIVEMT